MTGVRSRGGCFSCRQKRRKCDEAKPACNTCKARGVVCGGYQLRVVEFQAQGNYSGQMICRLARGPSSEAASAAPTRRRRQQGVKRRGDKETPESAPDRSDQISAVTPESNDAALVDQSGGVNGCPTPKNDASTVGAGQDAAHLIVEDPRRTAAIDRRDSHDISARSETSLGASPSAATYSAAGSESTQLGSQSTTNEEAHNDWAVFGILDAAGLESQFDFLSEGDTSWDGVQTELDAPDTALFPPLAGGGGTEQHLYLLGSADVSNNNQKDRERVMDGAQDISADVMPQLEGLDEPCFQPVDQPSRSLDLEPMATPVSAADDASSLLGSPDSQPDIQSPFDSYLYSHFFNVLAPGFYPVAPNRNPYKLVYGKLASTSQPLRATILGASALHLSGMGQLPPGVVSLYRDASLVSFNNALRTDKQAETLAATLMLSITVESIGNGTDIWTSKLHSARSLLLDKLNAPAGQNPSIVISFLRLQFNWMTAIGRTVQCHGSQLLDTEHLEFIDDPLFEQESSQDQARWFCNLPDYRLFCLLKEATQLYHGVLWPSPDNEAVRCLIPDIADLLHRVNQWKPSPSSASAPYIASVAQVSEIWRQGLLCFIYADICALPSSDRRVRGCVRRGMDALRSLSWMQSIMWPIFMLGVHVLDEDDRQLLENTCNTMSVTVSFAMPRTFIGFFRKVWADMEGTGKSRWRFLMMESGIQINLVL